MIDLCLSVPNSFLILCPGCWDCWARVSGEDTRYWMHRYVPCEACPEASFPYGGRLAGSLVEAEEAILSALPPEFLRREFDLYLGEIDAPVESSPCL
jgi:hypothetical protein